MKVVALGAGAMGGWAARTALSDDRVQELVVADAHTATAEQTAASLGPRARPATVDVLDTATLRATLRGADVVMNTVGPFYRFGVPVLRAAIEAGCNYLDICDDWEPTLEMLDLHAEAQTAGITAIIGLGASPGVSNLLAVKAIRALDRVDSIFTVWSLDGAAPQSAPGDPPHRQRGPSAATVHGVHQMTGRICAFEGGRELRRRPLHRLEIDYPGLGRACAWTIGHPESVTLPRVFPALRQSANAMFSKRSTIGMLKALMLLVDLRLASVERVARWIERIESIIPSTPVLGVTTTDAQASMDLPPLFALAVGERSGQPARAAVALTSAPAGGMGAITGIPLALGVSLLADGALDRRGVFPPEGIVDPDALFAKLAPLCQPRVANPADLALLSTSWNESRFWEAFSQVRTRQGAA